MRVGSILPRVLPALTVAALALAIGAVACRRTELRDSTKRTAAHAKGPGIVLLCIDTLRADAVALDPNAKHFMPALDEFARGATAFGDAASSSSWTAPSVATLLSGLLPANTGVHGAVAAGALPGSVTTLAESLRDRGYATAACTSGGWLVPERGYGQGFDSFSSDFDGKGAEAEIAAWQASRKKDAPFFLFLHTCAAHDPYGAKDARWLSDPALDVAVEAKRIAGEMAASGKLPSGAGAWFLGQYLFDCRSRVSLGFAVPAEPLSRMFDLSMDWLDGAGRGTPELDALLARAPGAYRAGLTEADALFARTLAALDALHLPADTIVAVTGDHGEALGEHGTLSHGRFLYDELVRVPLLVRAPGRLPAGRVVRGSCGLVDVAPTLLDLAGAPLPSGIDGRSLASLAAGSEEGHPVFADEERSVPGDARPRPVRIVSVRTEAAKFLLTYDLRTHEIVRSELYDLAADPGETTPLSDDPSRFGADFCRAASRLRSSIPGQPTEVPCGAAVR